MLKWAKNFTGVKKSETYADRGAAFRRRDGDGRRPEWR